MSNTLLKTTPSSKRHLAVAPLVDRGDQVGTQSRTANPYRSLRARRASAKTHAAHTHIRQTFNFSDLRRLVRARHRNERAAAGGNLWLSNSLSGDRVATCFDCFSCHIAYEGEIYAGQATAVFGPPAEMLMKWKMRRELSHHGALWSMLSRAYMESEKLRRRTPCKDILVNKCQFS